MEGGWVNLLGPLPLGRDRMKRVKVAKRLEHLAQTLELIGEISDQHGENLGYAYRDSASMVRREARKIKDHL